MPVPIYQRYYQYKNRAYEALAPPKESKMTYIIWIIKNPKEAIIAALAFIGAALYALLKLKSAKVEKLENEVQTAQKETQITSEQAKQVSKIKDAEPEEIILKVKENAKKSKSDRIDSW